MPALERRISLRGPRFWMDEGGVMFCNQLDSSTRDGPRKATDADIANHPDAYDAWLNTPEDEGPGKPMISVRDPAVKPEPPPKPFAARRAKAADQGEVA